MSFSQATTTQFQQGAAVPSALPFSNKKQGRKKNKNNQTEKEKAIENYFQMA